MFETKGEIEKYPQWIELYNNDTSDINLNGWKIILIDRSFSIDYDLIIKPNGTVLIASHIARFSENIVWDNLYVIDETIIDESTLNNEFFIRLYDDEDRKIDHISTLDIDDHSRWDMLNCIVQKENDARTSIIRRFSEGEPVEGSKRVAWIRAYNTKSIINSDRWYGNKTDIGTPNYRSERNPLPVQLSLFTAKFDGDKVRIEWITEAEIDNAGFNVYRSETRDGEFKVVNTELIQGAGTTGERNEYTWTDMTAKPNVEYYYQIEDVSFAGYRQMLTTARTKGIFSAKDRFVTQWGALKR